MALRNIVEQGDEILRKVCRPVDKVDDRIRGILDDMVETMRNADGVGLAAPQVGIMRRMFVVEVEPGEVYYMVNPEIVESTGSQCFEEGCLSVPGYVGSVDRPERIKIKATGYNGEEVTVEADGLLAVAFCHENDHLDGILYVDKATNVHLSETGDEE